MGDKNSSVSGVVVGILILASVIGGLVLYQRRGADSNATPVNTSGPADSGATAEQRAVLVNRSYANGVHRFRGSITVPTPCHTLTHRVEQTSVSPVETTIHFTIVQPVEGQICTQVLADAAFDVTVSGPESLLPPRATLDGRTLLLVIGGKE